MFVTKKKFSAQREMLRENFSRITKYFKDLQAEIALLKSTNVVQNDTLFHLSESIKEDRAEIALLKSGAIVQKELAGGEMSRTFHQREKLDQRIDNLIEAENDAAERHNHNTYTSNNFIAKCNIRFAKYDALIENLESQIQTQAATSRLAENRASFAAVLAVEFEYNSPVAIGKTFWLKVQRNGKEIMEQGTWNGLFFDQPDNQRLPHEYVLEVGEEIKTPIIED